MGLDDWLRWEAGEKKEVLIQSDEPVKKLVHWDGEMYVECEKPDCPWCDDRVKRWTRYAVEALAEDDVWTWEMAKMVYGQVKDIAEEYGGLRGLHLKVKRTGEGRKTRYTIIPLGVATTIVEDKTMWDPGAIARDPEGAIAFVQELAASLKMTGKEAKDRFLVVKGEEYADKDGVSTLVALIKWLDLQCEQARREAEENVEIDLDSLLT